MKNDLRPPIHERMLRLAEFWSQYSTCSIKHGAVIFEGNRVISSGYNGSKPGDVHCVDEGCLMYRGHCIRTEGYHAENNAIVQAVKYRSLIGQIDGYLTGYSIAITASPCRDCQTLIESFGIDKVYYRTLYRGIKPETKADRNKVTEYIHVGW